MNGGPAEGEHHLTGAVRLRTPSVRDRGSSLAPVIRGPTTIDGHRVGRAATMVHTRHGGVKGRVHRVLIVNIGDEVGDRHTHCGIAPVLAAAQETARVTADG